MGGDVEEVSWEDDGPDGESVVILYESGGRFEQVGFVLLCDVCFEVKCTLGFALRSSLSLSLCLSLFLGTCLRAADFLELDSHILILSLFRLSLLFIMYSSINQLFFVFSSCRLRV